MGAGFSLVAGSQDLTAFLPSLLSEGSWLIGTQVTAEGHTDLRPPQHTHGPQAQHDEEAQN